MRARRFWMSKADGITFFMSYTEKFHGLFITNLTKQETWRECEILLCAAVSQGFEE
ncbi:hypothetical protein Pan161_00510 [Gimesia algae]|uniref:Uncharacterized protein n=1 Tax=Gimesia algae TaxID=2527971 RepID=A0A517V613_9PLAN|nr:hypothetical protein Pan161_00510 [Gimesia algae]